MNTMTNKLTIVSTEPISGYMSTRKFPVFRWKPAEHKFEAAGLKEVAGAKNHATEVLIDISAVSKKDRMNDEMMKRILVQLVEDLGKVARFKGKKVSVSQSKTAHILRVGATGNKVFSRLLGKPGQDFMAEHGPYTEKRNLTYFDRNLDGTIVVGDDEVRVKTHLSSNIVDDGCYWLNPYIWNRPDGINVVGRNGELWDFKTSVQGLTYVTDTEVSSEATMSGIIKGQAYLPYPDEWNKLCEDSGIGNYDAAILAFNDPAWSIGLADGSYWGSCAFSKRGENKWGSKLPRITPHRMVAHSEIMDYGLAINQRLQTHHNEKIVDGLRSYDALADLIGAMGGRYAFSADGSYEGLAEIDYDALKGAVADLKRGLSPNEIGLTNVYRFITNIIGSPSADVTGDDIGVVNGKHITLIGMTVYMRVCQFRFTPDGRIVHIKDRGVREGDLKAGWYEFKDWTHARGPVFTQSEFATRFGKNAISRVVKDGEVRFGKKLHSDLTKRIDDANTRGMASVDGIKHANMRVPRNFTNTSMGEFAEVSWIEGCMIQGGDSDDTLFITIGPDGLNWRFRFPPVHITLFDDRNIIPEVIDVKVIKKGGMKTPGKFNVANAIALANQIAEMDSPGRFANAYNAFAVHIYRHTGTISPELRHELVSVFGEALLRSIDVRKHYFEPFKLNGKEIGEVPKLEILVHYMNGLLEAQGIKPYGFVEMNSKGMLIWHRDADDYPLLQRILLNRMRLHEQINDWLREGQTWDLLHAYEEDLTYRKDIASICKTLMFFNETGRDVATPGFDFYDHVTAPTKGQVKEYPELSLVRELLDRMIRELTHKERDAEDPYLEAIFAPFHKVSVMTREPDMMLVDPIDDKPFIPGTSMDGTVHYTKVMRAILERDPQTLSVVRSLSYMNEQLNALQYHHKLVEFDFACLYADLAHVARPENAESVVEWVYSLDIHYEDRKQMMAVFADYMFAFMSASIGRYQKAEIVPSNPGAIDFAAQAKGINSVADAIAFVQTIMEGFDGVELDRITLDVVRSQVSQRLTAVTVWHNRWASLHGKKYVVDTSPIYGVTSILTVLDPNVVREMTLPEINRLVPGTPSGRVGGLYSTPQRTQAGRLMAPKITIAVIDDRQPHHVGMTMDQINEIMESLSEDM